VSDRVPVLCNLKPSGEYLMEDFFEAGGLRALLAEISDLLHLGEQNVLGRTLGEALDGHQTMAPDVIRRRENPLKSNGGLAVLRGNIAPSGCVIKRSAASPHLLQHRGRVVAFESYADFIARIDEPELDIDANAIIVVKNIGPRGAPGMPEWGMLPLPKKLLEQGVRDMIRISDARMSGTAFGTVVLHVSPEAAAGGAFALTRTGDTIELDVDAGRIHLDVSEAELARRQAEWRAPAPRIPRGWGALYARTVGQAHEGCDLDFLLAGDPVPEPEIYG
jgi:dihydroxyacid dehydratase/phosphogluconate dehydratase